MKQVQRVLTLVLALFLVVGVPAIGMAGGDKAGKSAADTSATDKSAADKSTTGDKAPSASPSTSTDTTTSGSVGQASPKMPATAADCKADGWKKHGFKSEAECTAKVKK